MKILITGTAGFIGFHLMKRLLDAGWEVRGLDVINDYYDIELKYARLVELGFDRAELIDGRVVSSRLYPNASFIKGALEDSGTLNRAFSEFKPEVVCNLAAQAGVRYSLENPHAYMESNMLGFLNILEACRTHKVGHLLYASSSSVYGLNEKMPFSTSDNVDHPISLYAASKKSNELMAHVYSHLFNLPTTGLRFFTVYGPWGRPDMALFLFTDAMLKNEPIKVFNHGNMVRDFTYIDDIVEGVVRMLDKPPKGNPNWSGKTPDPASSPSPYRIYNIGNGSPVKLGLFISTLEEVLNKKAKRDYMDMQPGDVKATHSNVAPLKTDFDYVPGTSVRDGIEAFVEWYLKFYKVNV